MADTDRSALDDARKRARRRLVGATVLALCAAVVLPLFLETDPKPLGPDVQLQIPPIDDGKFQNRLTPETKGSKDVKAAKAATPDGGRASAKEAIAPVAPPPPASASMDIPKNTPPAAAKAAPTLTPATPPPATAATTPGTTSAGTNASIAPVPSPAPAAPAAPPAPAAPAATPAAAAGPATSANGAFIVQLGAFVGLPVAVELADKAREQGFAVFLEKVTTTGGQVHRVRVGPYATQSAAQADAVKLKLAGFTADVRKR